MHTQTMLQHYFCQFPNSLLSCAPNHPLIFFAFPCVPPLSLSLPRCFFSLTHTHPFPFQQSVPVQILSDFLSAAQHFTAAFFPQQLHALLSLPAVSSLLQQGEPLGCIFQESSVLHTCSGYSVVCFKNKQGGIHCSGIRG